MKHLTVLIALLTLLAFGKKFSPVIADKAFYLANLLIAFMILFINISSNVSADSGYVRGTVVVNFKAGTTQDEITVLKEEYNLEVSDNLPQINYYVFKSLT